VAHPDLSFHGRLTRSQTTVTSPPDHPLASEQLKNNRRTTEYATPETTDPQQRSVVSIQMAAEAIRDGRRDHVQPRLRRPALAASAAGR
jgi:hypothetical protein